MEQQDLIQKQVTEEDILKKKKFEELYKQQQAERENQKEQKKIIEQETKDPKEKMVTIQNEFKLKFEQINQKINKFDKKSGNIDGLFQEMKQIKEYLVQTNYALTTFDKQLYKEQIEKLEKLLFQLRDVIQPRKKFQFSRRAALNKQKVQEIQHDDQKIKKAFDFSDQIQGFKNITGQNLKPERSQLTATYKLDTIDKCKIELNSIFEALYVKNIKNSVICIGPAKSSVFIDNCQNCQFQIMGHQLRIHNCTNTKFNIFTPTKCIIENCTKLIFSKYNYSYDKFQEDFNNCGYVNQENIWNKIDDFNWLKQEKSPNFEIQE